jgi:hypothetical protein
MLCGAVARLAVLPATQPVEQYDNADDQRDTPQHQQRIRHG